MVTMWHRGGKQRNIEQREYIFTRML